jgi:hypothetical protein
MVFNKATAAGFRQVQYLRDTGRYEEARQLQTTVEQAAPPASSCGAGSCGLEEIRLGSEEAEKMRKMGLDPTKALKDKVRGCKNCGEQKIVYDLRNKKKACMSCEAKAKYAA